MPAGISRALRGSGILVFGETLWLSKQTRDVGDFSKVDE